MTKPRRVHPRGRSLVDPLSLVKATSDTVKTITAKMSTARVFITETFITETFITGIFITGAIALMLGGCSRSPFNSSVNMNCGEGDRVISAEHLFCVYRSPRRSRETSSEAVIETDMNPSQPSPLEDAAGDDIPPCPPETPHLYRYGTLYLCVSEAQVSDAIIESAVAQWLNDYDDSDDSDDSDEDANSDDPDDPDDPDNSDNSDEDANTAGTSGNIGLAGTRPPPADLGVIEMMRDAGEITTPDQGAPEPDTAGAEVPEG